LPSCSTQGAPSGSASERYRSAVGLGERAIHIDHVSGQEAAGELPGIVVDAERGVPAHAAALVDGERRAQGGLVQGIDGPIGRALAPHLPGRAIQEARMGRAVVVLVEEGVQTDIDLVQRGHGAELVEAALAQRAPEALHLADAPGRRRAWRG
jgi:hypothetical protein